jgi:hypothetical protein
MLTKRADISSIRGPRRIYSGRLVSKSDRLLDGSIYTMPIQTVQGRNYKVWVTKDLSSWTLQQTYSGDGTQKVFSFDPTTISAGPLHSLTHPSSYFFRVEVILP